MTEETAVSAADAARPEPDLLTRFRAWQAVCEDLNQTSPGDEETAESRAKRAQALADQILSIPAGDAREIAIKVLVATDNGGASWSCGALDSGSPLIAELRALAEA